jgi:hypothetical protein
MDSWAPASGFHGASSAQALAQSSKADPVSAPAAVAVPCKRERRVKMVMIVSSIIVRHLTRP